MFADDIILYLLSSKDAHIIQQLPNNSIFSSVYGLEDTRNILNQSNPHNILDNVIIIKCVKKVC